MLGRFIYGAVALVFTAPSLAQACEDRDHGPLPQFLGDWQSDGEAFGQPAQSRMKWTSIMDGCFHQLDYRIETNPGSEESWTFLGRGTHYFVDGDIEGHWIDNNGDLHDLRGSASDTELLVYWGEATGQLGRSRYALTEDGAIQVTDWVLTDEGWRQFNNNRFERVTTD
ncbi:hypothetical protein [Hyphobacterium sp.]|jgi:hypothetical protein|uniref:hypothetical protein n=1 Tax=Hyphobacterium sp. TaxID=2004662 RepID=UPI003BADA993